MIVPMKKVSLIILGDQKEEALKKLRQLGAVQIEITEGAGEKLPAMREQIALLESAFFTIGKKKKVTQIAAGTQEALSVAEKVAALSEEKRKSLADRVALVVELERLKSWGEIDIGMFRELAEKRIDIPIYEMPTKEYNILLEYAKTVRISASKAAVRFMLVESDPQNVDLLPSLSPYRFVLPQMSTAQMRQKIVDLDARMNAIDAEIAAFASYTSSLKAAVKAIEKEIEFETYATGMATEDLTEENKVAYFTGYIEEENLDHLKQLAADNAWGLLAEDPTQEDNVPTKLKNNKFVSLIYPLTDFLNTVPGYFEYDISGWFLGFILIFFGIIFGDGGYGLLISAIAGILILKARMAKKTVEPAFLLIGLLGLSTVLWGTLTCTWFGLAPEQLPKWLQSLSIPVFSNVYEDRIWYPFWMNGTAGLTTAQNLQIFCFSLAEEVPTPKPDG